ncbi:MAG: DUF5618 family protein [Elusimicrobiota bacterium]
MKEENKNQSEEYFREAVRYYYNAKQILKKAKIKYDIYTDTKPVREACGICYLAVLEALNGYFILHGMEKKKLPDTFQGYWTALEKYLTHNGKLKSALQVVYQNLHIFGYYHSASEVNLIKSGFEKAHWIIKTLSGNKL